MLILTNTTDKLEVIVGTAADIDTHVSGTDSPTPITPSSNATPFRQNQNRTTAATHELCAAPAASTVRNVKTIHIFNKDTTDSTDITVVYDAAGTDFVLHKCNLAPGEALEYIEGIGFFEITPPATATSIYNQALAAQGPGFAADTYVTGSNLLIGGRAKVGTRLQWRIHMSKTAASTAVTAAIIRFGTAGAIGDTARVTMAGPAQTAVVDEGVLLIEATVQTAGATGVVRGNMGLQHSAAVAAGFGEMFDAITSSAFDLTVSGLQAGISLNGSTAAAWTITQVQAQAENLA